MPYFSENEKNRAMCNNRNVFSMLNQKKPNKQTKNNPPNKTKKPQWDPQEYK